MSMTAALACCAMTIGADSDEGYLKGAANSALRPVEFKDASKEGIDSFKQSTEFKMPDEVRFRQGSTMMPWANGPTLTVGVDLLFMVPRFESNPAFTVTDVTNRGQTLPPVTAQRFQEFDYDYSVTPRLSLGAQFGVGVGARIRWMHFDQSAPVQTADNPTLQFGDALVYRSVASTSPLLSIGPQTTLPAVNSIQTPNPLSIPQVFEAHTDLVYDLWDFEATFSDLRSGAWTVELFGGMRYAHLNQHYNAFSGPGISQSLLSGQSFNGAGPTFGLEGRRELGLQGLAFRGLGRVSMLFGEDEHTLRGVSVGLVPPFTPTEYDSAVARHRILPIIDMELGLDYVLPLGRLLWSSNAGFLAQLIPAGSGANGNGNMGFFGFVLGTGVKY